MSDNRTKYVKTLEEFRSLVISYRHSPSQEVRTAIVKISPIVRKIVAKAKAGRTITIASPPTVGGVIMRDLNPFDLIFNAPHGVDIIATVVDSIDEAIGTVENDEHFSIEPQMSSPLTQTHEDKAVTRITVTKDVTKILGMSQEAFWPLVVAVIGAAFYIGLRMGQAKFDGEKIDLYNSNQSYKQENYSLLKQLGVEQSNETNLSDSLRHTKQKLQSILKDGTSSHPVSK